ncbi:putative retrotransposon hot spot protein 4 (RHS4) [Trypanosoma vivax]|nr:putative retrotransposon hot spot protein 4 (RHS4) [Trypanosoma vivax]
MDVVIQRPERFITDDDLREMVLSLPECQTYALVYKAVPLLRRKGITGLLQWGGADENADAKRAVRDALADDGLWNTVCSLLDIAFNVAKDAEARGKVGKVRGRSGKGYCWRLRVRGECEVEPRAVWRGRQAAWHVCG